jgi:hypothetical protein
MWNSSPVPDRMMYSGGGGTVETEAGVIIKKLE